jgi:hypothetical protein
MHGPYAAIDRQRTNGRNQKFDFLEAGKRYRVCAEFRDFDGDVHVPGEEWTFLGSSFLPYEDGLSLFVSLDDTQEWQIRMQWLPEAQGDILNHLAEYLLRV